MSPSHLDRRTSLTEGILVNSFHCDIVPSPHSQPAPLRFRRRVKVVRSKDVSNLVAILEFRAVKLALACMTKQPNDFETWLAHHASIGISRFYLRIEGTPELAKVLDQPRWRQCVHATFVEAGVRDNGGAQTDRQMKHLNEAISHARAEGRPRQRLL